MNFKRTTLPDVRLIDFMKIHDERGFLAFTFLEQGFHNNGIDFKITRTILSSNPKAGTLRGIHFQTDPFSEQKLVCCLRGKIHDVIIDMRRLSQTYLKSETIELSEDHNKMLYIPPGFAHGLQTLTDNTVILYHIDGHYSKENSIGIRWNDPLFNINWQLPVSIISEQDQSYPDYKCGAV